MVLPKSSSNYITFVFMSIVRHLRENYDTSLSSLQLPESEHLSTAKHQAYHQSSRSYDLHMEIVPAYFLFYTLHKTIHRVIIFLKYYFIFYIIIYR